MLPNPPKVPEELVEPSSEEAEIETSYERQRQPDRKAQEPVFSSPQRRKDTAQPAPEDWTPPEQCPEGVCIAEYHLCGRRRALAICCEQGSPERSSDEKHPR